MSKFEVGDKIEMTEACFPQKVGDVFTLKKGTNNMLFAGGCCHDEKWKKIGGSIFEIGDRVNKDKRYGNIGYIAGDLCCVQWDDDEYEGCIELKNLTKIGGSMSKYKELKDRINALENGWDKEADDILQEIVKDETFVIAIPCNNDNSTMTIHQGRKKYAKIGDKTSSPLLTSFTYTSQCDKLSAFKLALLWLLDNSDIKKDEKKDKIKEIEGKIEELQKEIRGLK